MMHQFKYNNTTISYKKEGSGFPVVLVHGFAEDSSVWHFQIDFLQQHFLVIAPDLPGSGESELLSSTTKNDVTIDDYAASIFSLLQHENIGACVVLGHSMGGYITLALAEKHPEMVLGFGFVHSTAFADNDEKRAAREKGIATIEQYGAAAFIKATTPNLFSKQYKEQQAADVAQLIDSGSGFTNAALQQYYKAMMLRTDKTNLLRNTSAPVLFIVGQTDVAVPLTDSLQQVYLPTVSYIHILEGVGHMGMWERPRAVNEYLLEFIQDVTERKRSANG